MVNVRSPRLPRLPRRPRLHRLARLLAATALVAVALPASHALAYTRISGEGSSWAGIAIDAMRVNVQQYGISVDFNPSGSTAGRQNFLTGTVDFAASDIPFQFRPEDGSAPENPVKGSYVYIPVTAGGTAFMYNLKIGGKQVTNLRLSGQNVAKIFTGVLTMWNDPAIQADNPGLVMPARSIVPVVRSDGSGSTAQFSLWLIKQHGQIWKDYCSRTGRAAACGETSFYPTVKGMIAQSGDLGVAGYITQGFAEGAIGYVNYSYSLASQFPVAKVLNASGYYTEPTPENVAVSLLKAQINNDAANPEVYLTQNLDGVYTDTDPRNYPLSSYSYFILPTVTTDKFTTDKGETLGAFAYYAMCTAQQQSASLGYSPIPINLVTASFEQIRKIPGAVAQNIDVTACNNPTFSPDGTNLLADNAPQPQPCDKTGGASQCPDGTGGLANVPTAVGAAPAPSGGGSPTGANTGAGPAAGGAATPAAGSNNANVTPVGGAPGAAQPSGPASPTGGANPGVATGSAGQSPAGAPAAGAPATGDAAGSVSADPSTTDPTATTVSSESDATVVVGVVLVGVGTTTTAPCDADTGECTGSPTQAAGAESAQAAPGRSTVIGQQTGWNTSALLVILLVVLAVALVIAPPLLWRYFRNAPGR